MRIIYYILLFFSFGGILAGALNNFIEIRLIVYSFSPQEYFFEDKLFYMDKVGSDNSSGSQGNFIYYGIVESTGEKGSINGWTERMEKKIIFDTERESYYFNIWYCPELNIIVSHDTKEINSFHPRIIHAWAISLLYLIWIPVIVKLFKSK